MSSEWDGLEAEVTEDSQIEDLRRALVATQRKLIRARAKVDDLVEATIESAKSATLSMGPVKNVPAPAHLKPIRKAAKPEVALLVSSDWQGSKVTSSYNSEVMERRVKQFFQKSFELTEMHRSAVPVDDAVIVFGGDMVEGLWNYANQPFEIDSTLFGQYVRVSRLLVDVVRMSLANYKKVHVVPEWGNHGRLGSKRDVVPRSDNLDRMCYELAKQLLAGEDRLTWQDCPEDVQRLEIGAYRAVVLHGDEIGRMGFAAPATIVQHINRWKSGSYRVDGQPWAFRDAFIHHYHTHNEWALADGEGAVYQTASTESDNRYASIGMASAALPSQRLHFVDPVRGRTTSQHKIWLD